MKISNRPEKHSACMITTWSTLVHIYVSDVANKFNDSVHVRRHTTPHHVWTKNQKWQCSNICCAPFSHQLPPHSGTDMDTRASKTSVQGGYVVCNEPVHSTCFSASFDGCYNDLSSCSSCVEVLKCFNQL